MAEKQYAVVNDQNVENTIIIDTDDLTQFQNDLDSSLSLVEVEGLANKGWKYYSTSSNSIVSPISVGGDPALTLTNGTDYSSYTYTVTSNTSLASVSNVRPNTTKLCTCTINSATLTNPTTITIVMAVTDIDYTSTDDEGNVYTPRLNFTGDFVDTNGFKYEDLNFH